ncbi:TfoX/Sxy family DNA transformation protein [Gemmata sp.]|uniref:TfoX/Sxy family DNA transformation protein n=1 Tax=Gemmata sp. TaxID=1914242 RepID=UPI003F6E993C
MTDGDPIATLKNLGPTSADWLRGSGVATVGDLRRLGPVVAYLLVKGRRPGASLNLLWALAAGLHGRDWRDLSEAAKWKLRREVDAA